MGCESWQSGGALKIQPTDCDKVIVVGFDFFFRIGGTEFRVGSVAASLKLQVHFCPGLFLGPKLVAGRLRWVSRSIIGRLFGATSGCFRK